MMAFLLVDSGNDSNFSCMHLELLHGGSHLQDIERIALARCDVSHNVERAVSAGKVVGCQHCEGLQCSVVELNLLADRK